MCASVPVCAPLSAIAGACRRANRQPAQTKTGGSTDLHGTAVGRAHHEPGQIPSDGGGPGVKTIDPGVLQVQGEDEDELTARRKDSRAKKASVSIDNHRTTTKLAVRQTPCRHPPPKKTGRTMWADSRSGQRPLGHSSARAASSNGSLGRSDRAHRIPTTARSSATWCRW